MYLQGVNSVYDLIWTGNVTYGDVHHQGEVEWSHYNFEEADVDMLLKLFGMYEAESLRMNERGLVLPSYDYTLKCSHVFNLLDARGAISVTETNQLYSQGQEHGAACRACLCRTAREAWVPAFEKNGAVHK